MNKNLTNLAKGVALGMMAGAAAGYAGKKMMDNSKKPLKKKAGKALKEMSNMMDTASYMFK